MAKAFADKADYVGYELVNEEDCLRAAAEAIGLREMIEALEAPSFADGYIDHLNKICEDSGCPPGFDRLDWLRKQLATRALS
jgi:hypothetical protein